MVRDQLDPEILNMDPERSFTSQTSHSAAPSEGVPKLLTSEEMSGPNLTKPKPKLRRKKVYWNRVDAREGNIWSALRKLEMNLKHDQKEFERLFLQSIDASQVKEQIEVPRSTSISAKNVKVIE